MALWTAKQVWLSLSRERREAAALAFWEDERLSRAARLSALGPWLTSHGMRAAFLEQLPRSRRAQMMAGGGLPEETATEVLTAYHLLRQRPLLARFLDELDLPHENGLIKDGVRPSPPTEEAASQAVEKLRAEFAAEDVDLYVRTLTAADPETWAALAPLAGDPP